MFIYNSLILKEYMAEKFAHMRFKARKLRGGNLIGD